MVPKDFIAADGKLFWKQVKGKVVLTKFGQYGGCRSISRIFWDTNSITSQPIVSSTVKSMSVTILGVTYTVSDNVVYKKLHKKSLQLHFI